MVAVPETAGVHWKTRSGALPGVPQRALCVLAPLVVPLKVPPWAGIAVGLLQAPASVVVVVVVAVAVVVVDPVEVVVVARVGWKTAHTAYQPVAVPRVAVPRWAPAALDEMSSSNEEPLELRDICVYGTPALLTGFTVMVETVVTLEDN